MAYVRKFLKLFSISLIFFMFLIVIAYSSILYKPETLIFISNKILNDDYSIDYSDIDSKISLRFPSITLSNLSAKNQYLKDIVKAKKVELGIDIFNTILKGHINLSSLKLEDIQFLEESASQNSSSYKVQINDLFIKAEEFHLRSKDTFVTIDQGSVSVVSTNGELNDIPFTNINIFNNSGSKKYFFTSSFLLNEEIIKKGEFINLDNFSDTKINLYLQSNGYYDSELNNLNNLNKYSFSDSRLVTKSKYEINDIDMVLFGNIDESLSGLFSSNIPGQGLTGSILISNNEIKLQSSLLFDMADLLESTDYFSMNGLEKFDAIVNISNEVVSLKLNTNLNNTVIKSSLDELKKDLNIKLATNIFISDLSNPTYLIENKKFKAFIGERNNGFFSLGASFDKEIMEINNNDGFHIFLSLNKFKIDDLFSNNDFNNTSNLKSMTISINQLDIFQNLYKDQLLKIDFLEDEINASFSGMDLNGTIKIDSSNFIRIDLNDSKFDFINLSYDDLEVSSGINDINLRLVGKNIELFNEVFQNIDFYLLKNKTITTLDNIRISSKNLNIGPYTNNDKAYISYNKKVDLYKVKGLFEINNKNNILSNIIDYDFDYLSTNLNIQWISLKEIKDLEGDINFLLKDFQSKTSLPDSALLRALKIFNLNAIIENISNETIIDSNNLVINRAEGNLYVGKNRALISKPIKLETNEARMRWAGQILKDKDGLLDELDLNLEMRLKVSENIPWYAAIFGGIPALAGGIVFENILEESLDDVSTFKFNVKGSIESPKITRLD